MSRMSLKLPAKLQAQIAARVKSGDYGSPEQYVGDLLRRDRERSRQFEMEAFLLKRLDKSNAVEMDANDFARIRRRVEQHIRKAH